MATATTDTTERNLNQEALTLMEEMKAIKEKHEDSPMLSMVGNSFKMGANMFEVGAIATEMALEELKVQQMKTRTKRFEHGL